VSSAAAGDRAQNALSQRRRVGRFHERAQLAHCVLHRLERTGKRPLHHLERQRGSAEPGIRMTVLEDERILAGLVSAARLPIAHVAAGHHLELECDVFKDVRRVGAQAESLQKPAPLADAAAVLDESRHRAFE
jgi:hypothetical protein